MKIIFASGSNATQVQQHSTQFVLTLAQLNTLWNAGEFCHHLNFLQWAAL